MVMRDELSAAHIGAFDHLATDRAVHRLAYVDPAVFDAELARIFNRVWVYVGHESEVRQPGDYKTSWIGRQPVILSRDEDHRLRTTHFG